MPIHAAVVGFDAAEPEFCPGIDGAARLKVRFDGYGSSTDTDEVDVDDERSSADCVFIGDVVTEQELGVHSEIERCLARRHSAAHCIQRAWRRFRRLTRSTRVLQSACYSIRAVHRHRVALAANTIVSCWMVSIYVRRHLQLQHAVIAMQRLFRRRRIIARFHWAADSVLANHHRQLNEAALVVQRSVRRRRLLHAFRHTALSVLRRHRNQLWQSAVTIQRCYRAHVVRQKIRCLVASALDAYRCRVSQAALIVQRRYRRCRQLRSFRAVVESVLVAHRRACVAATTIQRMYRRRRRLQQQQQQQHERVLNAALVILRWFRVRRSRTAFRSSVLAALEEYRRRQHAAAAVLQKRFRSRRRRQRFQSVALDALRHHRHRILNATRLMQKRIRRRQRIDAFRRVVHAALEIHRARVRAVLKLQAVFRRRRLRNAFRSTVVAALQAHRSRQHWAATILQSRRRGQLVRNLVAKWTLSAETIQSCWRRHRSRRNLRRLKRESEINDRRRVVLAKLGSLPKSGDDRVQMLRERFSQRLADIEFNADHDGAAAAAAANVRDLSPARSSASVLNMLDQKRERLLRVRAQLERMRSRGTAAPSTGRAGLSAGPSPAEPASSSSATSLATKKLSWNDDCGNDLLDIQNHRHEPRPGAVPRRSCMKPGKNAAPRRRTCAQRITNVLSTTFGSARRCRIGGSANDGTENVDVNAAKPSSATVCCIPFRLAQCISVINTVLLGEDGYSTTER